MKCPKCGSNLDTGFNCLKCDYKHNQKQKGGGVNTDMDFIRISEIATITTQNIATITTQNTENLIVDSVYQSSHKVGVYIEKSKIKEWLEMCARIEKLTIEEQRSLAMQLAKEHEYIELKSELAKLQQFIETELEK